MIDKNENLVGIVSIQFQLLESSHVMLSVIKREESLKAEKWPNYQADECQLVREQQKDTAGGKLDGHGPPHWNSAAILVHFYVTNILLLF